ncbi:hypothetical protein K439DRAFT_1354089 [Ramaria rubella]|nr:hypothetical protein K439DRAFT_1354089 [Ramaria rubella]
MSIEGLKQKPRKPPIKLPDETPEAYLSRLIDAVSKAEVAHVLAASGDEFYTQSLRLYFEQFNFEDDPIDVALRKLLMEVGLPRETQQIDRVMEVFAARYVSCNPGLFVDDDHPYILAFSLIMLHTDAFNRSNKNKMSKNDYVKNTKLPGIPPEILECFFDNIVFAPFIFIEDPVDANPTKTSLSDGTSRHNPLSMPPTNNSGVLGNSTGTTILGKANKIDPYYLITQNLLGPLRADIHDHLPKSNPFLYEGTEWPWDTQRLHHLFALAQVVQVHVDTTSPPSPNPGTSSTLSTPTRRKSVVLPSLADARILRIARAGVLARKEDTTEGGKKSTNRKWRAWSVVLTGSQLLFFRDPNFASHLLGLPMDGPNDSAPEHGLLNPDEIVSLQGCIAVFDTTYTKYPHTFRFLISTGRQFIMQAPDERSLNEWISTINYACAFKSVGVQMRGLGLSHKDVAMTGVAAATSHLHDLRILNRATASTLVHTYGEHPAPQDTESLPSRPPSSGSSPRQGTGSKLLRSFIVPPSQVDLEMSKPHQLEGAQQFKATFDEVKAELAAQNTEQLRPLVSGRARTLSMGTHPSTIQSIKQSSRPDTTGSASRSEDMQHTTTNVVQSRSDIIQSNVETLDTQITGVQHELDAELRVARNLAILTPFQRATRDRIQVAVVPLAKRVKTLRINLARLVCYRFVLLTDLAEEERQWEQAKRDALKAATQRLSAADVQPPGIEWSPSSPRFPMDPPPTSETFYSTLDVPGSEPPAIVSPLVSMAPDHRAVLYSPSGVHHEYNGTRSTVTPSHFGPELSPVAYSNGHDHGSTATEVLEEIAEEWNETRAAKRVSLVKLPSEVKLSILRRQERNLDNDDRRWRGAESPTSFLNLS